MTVTAGDAVDTPAVQDGGRSMPSLLIERAATEPDRVALREKKLGRWETTTWNTYERRAAAIGLGLMELGVSAGDRVAIQGENSAEWVIADLGIQGIRAVSVGVYPTSPESELEYLLSHSDSKVLFAEDEEQLDKAMAVRHKTPELRHIVVVDTRGVRDLADPMVMTFAELEALGEQRSIDEWRHHVAGIDPTDPALIVYTSGTTGPPKGAMISSDNLLAAGAAFHDVFGVRDGDEVLSYLPLCHIAERLASVVNALFNGYVVNFGEGGESFAADMREVQPTYFLGVPRVWEKMLAGIQIRMNDATRMKRATYSFWLARGRRIAATRMHGKLGPFDRLLYGLGWLFLYRSIRDKLGLGRVRVAVSGAAPIAPQVLEFFWALGVPVREGYGQTEGTAMATYTPATDVRIGKVGTPLPGTELTIAADGEILIRGPGVFIGYLKNDEATRQTVDANGWLHTGDVGEVDSDGYLTITDRKKDIIITAGGKNISPSEIENRLKVSPYIREAVVIGDRRKYLTALIGIELETVGDWASRRGLSYTTYRDLTRKDEVRALVNEWVDQVNGQLAQVETIKKFELLPKELDQEEGELTATQKVKRSAIAAEFADLIEGMYR